LGKAPHEVWLPEYLIGRYPVTVAQYRVSMRATGYWISDAKAIEAPDDYPVADLTWREAMAFCDWVRLSGQSVRLPSETEWEKAARGIDWRIYPWANRWDPTRCNCVENGPGHIVSVDYYSPLGDSPCGCVDMVGNVGEWMRSLRAAYPFDA
jgi:formylglycine-generating enzyme required for sulfatase activity